jgi:multidrug efflux pump subunit AcrA (membrane-fusion protein)
VLAACGEGEAEGGANAGGAAPPPPEVTVATPLVRKLTEWDEFTGRFEPVQRVEIRARVTGYIQDIRFEDGQVVEKDQVLFVIDPGPTRRRSIGTRRRSGRRRPSSSCRSSSRIAPSGW